MTLDVKHAYILKFEILCFDFVMSRACENKQTK